MPRLTAADLPFRYQNQIATQLHAPKTHPELPNAVAQRHAPKPLGQAKARAVEGVGRIAVRFIGFRVRPLDPDGFAGSTKHLLDGLRHAGIIPDDSPEFITLETSQVKVASFKEERTEIEIDLP